MLQRWTFVEEVNASSTAASPLTTRDPYHVGRRVVEVLPITSRQIGVGLVVVALAAAGYVAYEYVSKNGIPGTTPTNATVANVQIALNPGATVKAGQHTAARIKFTNSGTSAAVFGLQGAMVMDGTGVVRGHWFTGYAQDSAANVNVPSARVATVTVPAGASGSVTLYQIPEQTGSYTAVFWIATNYASGLIATDTLYTPGASITLAVDVTQASTPITVS